MQQITDGWCPLGGSILSLQIWCSHCCSLAGFSGELLTQGRQLPWVRIPHTQSSAKGLYKKVCNISVSQPLVPYNLLCFRFTFATFISDIMLHKTSSNFYSHYFSILWCILLFSFPHLITVVVHIYINCFCFTLVLPWFYFCLFYFCCLLKKSITVILLDVHYQFP